MSSWQIEHVTRNDTTAVTIRNVTSQHIPLRLNGSQEANSFLIQLLRYAGYSEEEYPYQSYHSKRGWGLQVEGLGIVINQRYRTGDVPAHGTLYQLAVERESELLAAARHYAPFAQYFAASLNPPAETLVDSETIDELVSRVRKLEARSKTVYDTLYHGGNGALTRISSLEGTRQDTIDLPGRIQALEEAIGRLIQTLDRESDLTGSYATSVDASDGVGQEGRVA